MKKLALALVALLHYGIAAIVHDGSHIRPAQELATVRVAAKDG